MTTFDNLTVTSPVLKTQAFLLRISTLEICDRLKEVTLVFAITPVRDHSTDDEVIPKPLEPSIVN